MDTIRRRKRIPRCLSQSWKWRIHKRKVDTREWSDPIVASNMPLLIVAGFFFREHIVHATALASSAIASLLYHRSAEMRWLGLDRGLATIAFLSSLVLLRNYLHQPVVILLLAFDIIFAFAALTYSNSDKATRMSTATSPSYNRWHTVWHGLILSGQLVLLVF